MEKRCIMSYGYTGKILRINLSNKSVRTLHTEKYEGWGGGHGIGSAIFWDLCEDKTVSGFDPKNVVTIMTSPLAGTLSPSSARCEVQGIGPQAYPVEWFTRSNFGGRFSSQLKYAGWDGIVIEGRADAPVWINIVNDQVSLEDARTLWGLDTKETQQEIWGRVTGERSDDWYETIDGNTTQKPAVLCIGQAGENLSRIAVLMHDGGNAAGQGGFGGVFGSKNLKAISVLGTGGVKVANPQNLMESWLWHKANFQYNVDEPRREGPLPNFPDYWTISHAPGGGPMTAITEPCRPFACQACALACRRRTSSGLANEAFCMPTIWPLVNIFPMEDAAAVKARTVFKGDFPGSRIEPTDMYKLSKSRFRVTDLLDRYGLNAFEVFAADIYLIQLYYAGHIGPGMAIETDLPFDQWSTAAFKETLLRQTALREGLGNDLAEGVARAAEKWGRYQEDTDTGLLRHAHWGYMEHHETPVEVEYSYGSILGERDNNDHSFTIPVHEMPRIANISGTEPMLTAERLVEILSSKLVPFEGDPFMFDYSDGPTGIYSEHRVKEIAWHRHYTRFWTESVGYCDFIWPNFINANAPDMLGATPEGEPRFFNSVTGKKISFVDGMEIGRKIWNLDRAIWALQGRHRDMEVFSGYLYTKPFTNTHHLPVYEDGKWKYSDCTGRMLDRSRFEEWKTKYYQFEGWDPSSGWPTRATLEKMGLDKVADELRSKGRLGS
jgi:aldehyde:ferredoxin oxidoreductase